MRRLGWLWLMMVAGTAAGAPLIVGQCIVLKMQEPTGATSIQAVEVSGEGKGGYYLRFWVDRMWSAPLLSIDLNMSKAQIERLERVACPNG